MDVKEQVIEVSKISSFSRAVLLASQLVEVPVPESVILPRGTDAAAVGWCQVAGHQGARRSTGG